MARKVWRTLAVISLAAVLLATGFFGYFIYTVVSMEGLPPVETALTTRFYYANGDLLATRSVENRIEVPLSQIPESVQAAAIAVEDERFYSHSGIDIMGVARAMMRNLQEGRITQGGSTITQQLAKNLFLTHERTVSRKFQEAVLTLHLERLYSKDEILEQYLNTIYFGRGAYGIEVASLTYFGKNAKDLSLAESAFLVGMPQRPAMSWEAAERRQQIILAKMKELGYISAKEHEEALEEGLVPYQREEGLNTLTRYYIDTIIYRELRDHLPKYEDIDLLYRGGLQIYTTLDPHMQQAAEQAFKEYMPAPRRVDDKGVQQPQGALLAMDPRTGYIKAMVGGRDYQETPFNRAMDARRSPGSSFKPFVFAAAMEQAGFTAATKLECAPISIPTGSGLYEPSDYGGTFHHRHLTVREALMTSCNISAIKANMAVGPEAAADFARRMGISSQLKPVISLPLSSEATALDMTAAFSPFANRGIKSEPILVTRVEDSRGQVLLENKPRQQVVLDEGIAFIVSDMLKDVFSPGGTARHLAEVVARPAAAKTGTADREANVYIVGYTPELIATVYVGDDDFNYSLEKGSTGGSVAGPIWANFMREALKDTPVSDFQKPANVARVELCPETGLKKNPDCTLESTYEYFVKGTEPQDQCGPENCSGCQQQWWWPWQPFFWRNSP